jgi:formylglycine-generating enzyme required for sulfatase activity
MNFAEDTIGNRETGEAAHRQYKNAIGRLSDGAQFDRYTIVKLLGRGGMGAVYEARHVTLEEHFAIKVLPYEFMARRDAVQRFQNEARVMAKLKHPNIVKVDDFSQTDGLYWLRMELARGDGKGNVSLQDMADANNGIVDQAVLLDVMEDVLKGIAYAHRNGVIHRDLKPANILLFPKSIGGFTAKVSDYGLVKLLGEEFLRSRVTQSVQMSLGGAGRHSLGDEKTEGGEKGTSTRALLGTWAYMSPEQQEGAEATERSDVYSLGLMFFQLLTGEKLSFRLPSQIKEGVLTVWDDFVAGSLENKPERRYADAGAMLKALEPVRKAIHTSAERKQREKVESEIKAIREKAVRAVQSGDLETALSILKKAADTYPDHKRLRDDIADVQKRIADRNAARKRYRDGLEKAERLTSAQKWDEAFGILTELASEFRDKPELNSKIADLKKKISDWDAERRRAEQRKAEEERKKREEAEQKQREEAERRRQEDAKKRREEQARLEANQLKRERSRRRFLMFGGIGGVILLIAVIAGALFGGGGEDSGPAIETTGTKETQTFNLGGGVTLEMVYIPPGSFQMGSPNDEEGRYSDEGPVRRVTLDGFWMGKYPVTQAQYRAIMGSNPSHFTGDNRPVESVSWNDAKEFFRKLSDRTGKTFTLPTEAQWEYACRAGTTTRYSFGDDAGRLGEYAWYSGNSNSQTHPVGQKKPNAWGLYDMHGNVLEWCLDDWHDNYNGAPVDGSRWGDGTGSGRVMRGGGWGFSAGLCRSACRPTWDTPEYRWYDYGFRAVMLAGQ